jgi:uncharacterized protein GlcG (DUF336 family)
LRLAVTSAVAGGGNGGLGNNMWATVVNRDGQVCAVVFTGTDRNDQWPLSRVISAQKANTANGFSLQGFALSTGNLNGVVQPGGSANQYGQPNDPLLGEFVGGINVFGGGLALYNANGNLIGAVGVSGDTSCTDHIVAWRTRDALGLDNVPNGVADGTDNLIINDPPTPGSFEHPSCGFGEDAIIANLPTAYPAGANQ